MPHKETGDVSNPIKVLFVDDSVTMLKVAEITFATDSFELSSLSNGAEVLDGVKKNHPDVVLLDAEMPEVDGYEACRRLRQDSETGTVPVLLLSGPSNPYDERRARESGVTDHIDKPFETQALYDKVEALALATPTQPQLAPPTAAAPKPAAAPPIPAGKEPAAGRPKVGSKTVLGLGNMGYAPKPSPSQKGPPAPPAPPKAAAKPSASSRPGPVATPIGGKPAMQKPAAAPAAKSPPSPTERSAPPALGKLPPRDEVEEFADETVVEIAQPKMDAKPSEKASNLSPQQIEAIRAVAREVIEHVVWEVVPDLAETIIKEELEKLLRE